MIKSEKVYAQIYVMHFSILCKHSMRRGFSSCLILKGPFGMWIRDNNPELDAKLFYSAFDWILNLGLPIPRLINPTIECYFILHWGCDNNPIINSGINTKMTKRSFLEALPPKSFKQSKVKIRIKSLSQLI